MPNHWIDDSPILRILEGESRAQLADLLPMEAPAGHALFSCGSPCAGFPLVLSGVARVSLAAENGKGLVLYRIGPNDICIQSTLCLLGGRPYTAEAIAETAMRLVVAPRRTFDQLIAGSQTFRTYVFERFGARLQDITDVLEEVAFGSLDMRLARILLSSVQERGLVHLTHQRIAEDIGAAREAVTRRLNFFARAGIVRMTRGVVEIVDRGALAQMRGIGS